MLLYYLLLAPCLSYGTLLSSTDSLPVTVVLHYLLLGPCLYLYTYGILLPSTDPLPIPKVLYYLPLAHCLSLWYSSTFCWALPVHMVLYYLLLAPCLFLWYSTIFYWLTSNTYATLLSSTGPLPLTIDLYYFHLALPFVPPIPMVLYYILEAGRL